MSAPQGRSGWRWEVRPTPALPPLAWLMRARAGVARVDCGESVRISGEGFLEGTWAGAADLAAAAHAPIVMGSGALADGDRLVLVTPSHTLDGIFTVRRGDELVAANSLVALLVAAGLELRDDVPYPLVFGRINRGIGNADIEIPTRTLPIRQVYFHNLEVGRDGEARLLPKPVEPGYGSYAEYRDRTAASLRSMFANAPGYAPLVALSSGYDSTAAAVLGALAGMRRAASMRDAVAWRGYAGSHDSGRRVAAALGLDHEEFDRLAYTAADDMPEVEVLANGMSGEDIIFRSMEPALRRSVVLTGFWGGAAWRALDRSNLSRTDLSGTSLVEMRLRADFVHVPVPYIGGLHQPDLARIRHSEEMRPFSVGGVYDEPVPRRLAEEAGAARDAFATTKLAASRRFHVEGLAAMTPRARADFEAFAGEAALAALPRRRPFGPRHRLAIKLARTLRVPGLAAGLEERRRAAVHFEPTLGALLLRWAVDRLRPRYRPLVE